ncbi:unnamed protein product [Rhizoctonia solani]|uniref:Homeobox domain-containing protein n=1 Tax=Rhizoctonia solani TaxID=456999 RepID=A0A8H2WZW7_9AGAM|nr:unnamed protein product [Rhizoctonia solani]
MFSTPSATAMSVPLTSIRATLERHLSLTQDYLPSHIPSNVPLFDTHLAPSATSPLGDYAIHISSLGLPVPLASDVTKLISQESDQYRSFIEQVRLRQLRELSTTSVSPNHSSIPALVEAACNAFHELLIKSGVDEVRQLSSTHDNGVSDTEEQSSSEDDSDPLSDSEEEGEPGEVAFEDGEEDDNTPIKPGEDIPPLETKYLPIFEALHERGKVLTKPEKTYLVNMTGMTYRQITIWFQNRRRGELKESSTVINIHSKALSTHSNGSSEFSENELEKTLGAVHTSTAFDIRSWRMTSAFPTKNGTQGYSAPPSPTKHDFRTSVTANDSDTEDTDLSDSDDDVPVPPGLLISLLSDSVTATTASTVSAQNVSEINPHAASSIATFSNEQPVSVRPIRPLPSIHTKTPPSSQPLQAKVASVFEHNSAAPTSMTAPFTVNSPDHSMTSNEHGLTIQMNTPLDGSTAVLSSPPNHPNHPSTSPSTSASSPDPTFSLSRNISPTPSTHSGLSPRLPAKPLPRRTGCAPRPRPPPRAAPPSTVISTTAPSSARPSVILPPSSNPSLGNTTLGYLLRPNQPAPKISPEMEDRLTAMAGRMGVGTDTNLVPTQLASKQITSAAPASTRPNFSLPSFGPMSLPRLGAPSGPALPPAPSQPPHTLAGSSHS